jgi:glycolate oxidase FAD binding subunit
VPGDLTLTAGAGTTLAEVREATAKHGQWLALDPYGSDDGTLGATLATASAGPLATAFGTPRDLTLGVEVVTGRGVIARGGGRVVKNVAGFDLTRLFVGSWGTLGVITEVTCRLHARPQCDETFAIALPTSAGVDQTRQLLRRLPFTPFACEIVNAPLASRLVNSNAITALFRLGGNDEAVQAQRAALGALGEANPVDPAVWTTLRQSEPNDAVVFRLSQLPSEIGRTWNEASAIAESCAGTLVHAAPSRGVVRCIVPSTETNVAWLQRAFRAPMTSTRIGERLPSTLWPDLSPPPTADAISAGIKRTFDPQSILNRGIRGEPA